MIDKAKKDIEKFLKDKKEFYKKADALDEKHREFLVNTLINIMSEIMSKIRRGTPNGVNLPDLYYYKDNPSKNRDLLDELNDLYDVSLIRGGMQLSHLQDVILQSVENKHISFRYSYLNVDETEIFIDKTQRDIDLNILLHIITHLLKHPFFVDNNLKYLMSLNEYKRR